MTPTPVYPPTPTEWAPPYIPPYDVPGIVVPPVITPPPCNPDEDDECPPPPPPPDDVPEPATWLLLIVGILGAAHVFARAPRARIE